MPKTYMFDKYQDIDPDYIPNNMIHHKHPRGIKDIVRGTTPEHFLMLPFDVKQDIKELLVTYKQGLRIKIEKTLKDAEIKDNIVYYQLTQEETKSMDPTPNNPCFVQIKVKLANDDVYASDVYIIRVLDILNDEQEFEMRNHYEDGDLRFVEIETGNTIDFEVDWNFTKI